MKVIIVIFLFFLSVFSEDVQPPVSVEPQAPGPDSSVESLNTAAPAGESAADSSNPHFEDRKVSISINVAGNDGDENEPYFATFDATNLAYQWKKLATSYEVEKEHQVKTGDESPKGEVKAEETQKTPEAPLDIAQQVHDINEIVKTLPKDPVSDPEEQTRLHQLSKSIFTSSALFKEINIFNVMYYIHQHLPFGLFILCDCYKDYEYAQILQNLEAKLRETNLASRMTYLYIYPDSWRRFQLERAFQLGPDVVTMLGDSHVSEKKVLVPWGQDLTPPPPSIKVNIHEECCGDKFEIKSGQLTSQGFELEVKRTDSDKGWGQFLQVKWEVDPPLHPIPAFIIDNIPQGTTNEKSVFRREEGDVTNQLHTFIGRFFEGNLPLLVRSQPLPILPPLDRTPGKVVDVIGANFKEIVLDRSKDVFLLIYSPYCGASIAVQPVFEQTAAALKDDPNVIVARIDKTANDIPVRGVVVAYYPTAFLFPACDYQSANCPLLDFSDFNGSKSPHNRDVPHSHYTVEGMTAFVREHGFTYLGMVHKSS